MSILIIATIVAMISMDIDLLYTISIGASIESPQVRDRRLFSLYFFSFYNFDGTESRIFTE
jgi:hypothetical protein